MTSESWFTVVGQASPGCDDGDADHADRHADVGREVVEEVEEALAEDRHVRERAEAERAERAENGEDRARDRDAGGAADVELVVEELHGHLQNRDRGREGRNEEAHVEGDREEVAERELREDGGHRREGEAGASVGERPKAKTAGMIIRPPRMAERIARKTIQETDDGR